MIAESLNMSVGSVFTIMTEDLKKKKLCARFVPHTLTTEQKEHRIASSEDLIAAADEDPNFLKTIVTGDESCCLEYDPETKPKVRSGQVRERVDRLKFVRQNQKQRRCCLCFSTVEELSTTNSFDKGPLSLVPFTRMCYTGY
ncbi:FLJ37770-like protein [Nephila pilipes]|uniref:FLJ37770-like protein n=2 Tax=Nephila pilipes TaxID=299642 RepID=A0A8X6Q228_NEPPI|nr:FLJ37770-like protein [Nephila pilipes]